MNSMLSRFSYLLGCMLFSGFAVGQVLIDGPEVDLTLEDVQKMLYSMPPDVRGKMMTRPQKLRSVMDTTYMTKVVAQRARANKRELEPEVAARIWQQTQNTLAEAELTAQIAGEPGDQAGFESAARERYLVEKEAKYAVPESVEASHILIRITEELPQEAAHKETIRIREEIVTGKISFEEAAKQYSTDKGSADKGGSLARFSRGRMVKPFEDAVFALQKNGDISEPVATKFGYHLIRLDNKYPATYKTYEQVKQDIITQLQQAQAKTVRENYLLEIRDDPRVKLDEPAIQEFLHNPKL